MKITTLLRGDNKIFLLCMSKIDMYLYMHTNNTADIST